MRIISLSFLMVLSIISLIENTYAIEGKNDTARYLEGARLRCENNTHKKLMLQVFHDIINLPSDKLQKLRYEDGNADNKKLSLLDIFIKYIKPYPQDKTIGPGFYDELKTDEVQYKIKDIVFNFRSLNDSDKNTTSRNSIVKKEWIIRIESLFDIVIPQNVLNFAAFEEAEFAHTLYIRFTFPSPGELNLFLEKNSNFLAKPVIYSNPLKGITVNPKLKNKWHPDHLREYSGGTKALWKRKELRKYSYVYGNKDETEAEVIYLVCSAEYH